MSFNVTRNNNLFLEVPGIFRSLPLHCTSGIMSRAQDIMPCIICYNVMHIKNVMNFMCSRSNPIHFLKKEIMFSLSRYYSNSSIWVKQYNLKQLKNNREESIFRSPETLWVGVCSPSSFMR